MRRLLLGLGVCGMLGLGAAQADTFAGRADFFGPQNGTEKKATWRQADTKACRIMNPTIIIRKDGTAQFTAQVASTHQNDSYCVILDFFDKNQSKLFHFPKICSPTLRDTFNQWSNPNLAIPQEHYRFIVFATREDHC
jgi:hypothetical protein